MKQQFLNSLKIFIFFTLLFGVAYPVSITLIGQSFFANQASGSLLQKDGIVVGSEWLAQKTILPQYFWPRPSASDYGAVPSGASNLSLTSKKLHTAIKERIGQGLTHELLFSSASGLDPHISKDAALGQAPRISKTRNLDEDQQKELLKLIEAHKEKRQFGFLGEERINVLKLNLALITLFDPKS